MSLTLRFWLFPLLIQVPPHLHPLSISTQLSRLAWNFLGLPPGYRSSHPRAGRRGSPGEPAGVTCLLPHTLGMCCPFGPARIPAQGVSSTQHAARALWGHVRLPIKGVEVGGSCLLPYPSSP